MADFNFFTFNFDPHLPVGKLSASCMSLPCTCMLMLVCVQVMQKCDGVMASGHNMLTFAIPALQPLVLNLFVRPTREKHELEIQR